MSKNLEGETYQFDWISQLPDTILVEILSLLPVTDLVSTSVLSKRWKNIYMSCDINLDDSQLCFRHPKSSHWSIDQCWRFNAITQILTCNAGPVCRFRVSEFYYRVIPDSSRVLDSWVEAVTSRGVRELAIYNNGLAEGGYEVPPSILCCMSLDILELGTCKLPEPPLTIFLANLKVLKLRKTFLTDETICELLLSLSALERLELVGCQGFRHIQISSLSLREFAVETWMSRDIEEIAVEVAPLLENLLVDEHMMPLTPLRVTDASRLQMLGFVNAGMQLLQLGGSSFKAIPPKDVLTHPTHPVLSLKKLALKVDFNCNHQVKLSLELLRCFPRLEVLVVVVADSSDVGPSSGLGCQFWNQQDSTSCLGLHLRKVIVKGFVGQKMDEGFVRFIISHAQALDTMILHCRPAAWSMEWAKVMKRNICIENRASPDAEIVLKMDEIHADELLKWLVNA